MVKRPEPCKCDICHISGILWQENHSFFKRMQIMKSNTHQWLSVIIPPYKYMQHHSNEGCLLSSEKKLWCRVLEVNKKQVPLTSYSLKIRIDSVNQILKNKVTQTSNITILTRITTLRHWNTGLVSSGFNVTPWGEGASLALVGHPSIVSQ